MVAVYFNYKGVGMEAQLLGADITLVFLTAQTPYFCTSASDPVLWILTPWM